MSDTPSNTFLDGPLGLTYARTALPVIFVMAMNGVLAVSDALFLGYYAGPRALAAVTLMFPAYMLIVVLSTLVSGGMSSLLARHLGGGRTAEARAVFAGAHGLAAAAGGLLIALFGMAVAMVGPDASSGVMRLTFGIDSFTGGFSLLPVLLGVFVISQIIEDVLKKEVPIQQQGGQLTEFMPSSGDVKKHGPNAVRSSLIGTWLGVLPGVGSAIVAYTTKSFSKHPETFGTGEEAGIVAAEASNNASVNGALIPLITLGIPGSVIDAILIGALVIHNLQPGPLLFTNSPEIAYGVIAAALVANFMMAALMFAGVRPIARIATISRAYLFPTIIVCCVIGVYSLSNSMSSVWVMIAFGVLGFAFRRGGFPVGPFVLGYILAPLAEKELRSGLMLYDGSLMPLVTRPISLFFIVLTLVLALWPLVQARMKARG